MGPDWVYEIKHDGYRLMVRKREGRVRIYAHRGADWTKRFPRIVEAVQKLNVQSILIDGEGIICDRSGLAVFDLLALKENRRRCYTLLVRFARVRWRGFPRTCTEGPQGSPSKTASQVRDGIQFNEHVEGDGETVFLHACKFGCEGIVAKRIDLPYQSGRSKRWLKIKNPNSPAAKHVEEGTF
jgi:bifunctional non-homologous end joining protein LigD